MYNTRPSFREELGETHVYRVYDGSEIVSVLPGQRNRHIYEGTIYTNGRPPDRLRVKTRRLFSLHLEWHVRRVRIAESIRLEYVVIRTRPLGLLS